jgi:DNA-directed RNA polymerase beta subunit
MEFDYENPTPRRLHGSQFGYYCTNETPGGASIGISKNMSLLTSFSTAMQLGPFVEWIKRKGNIIQCEDVLESHRIVCVPLYINGGIFGYCKTPGILMAVLKAMKRTGCLPFSTSITFSYRWRRLNIYVDEGRPLRPPVLGSGGGGGEGETDEAEDVAKPGSGIASHDGGVATDPQSFHGSSGLQARGDPL